MKKKKTNEEFIAELSAKNPDIIPLDRYVNSKYKIRFSCRRCNEIWMTTPNSILTGTGCPRCCKTSTSFMEQYILWAFRKALPNNQVLSRDRTAIGKELDIYVPDLNFAIEPGNWKQHRKKIQLDEEKRKLAKDKDIRLVTIYDSYQGSNKPFDVDCYVYPFDMNMADHRYIRELVIRLFELLSIKNNFTDDDWMNIEKTAYERSKCKTTQQFKDELAKINKKVEVIGEYKTARMKIEVQCRICGNRWKTAPSNLLKGSTCNKCAIKKRADKFRKSTDDFIKELKEINSNIKVLGDYTTCMAKIEVECKTCGHKWKQTLNNLLKGYGCKKCASKNRSYIRQKGIKGTKWTSKTFTEKMSELAPDIELLEEYITAKTKIRVCCKICGHEWFARPDHLLRGAKCPTCAYRKKGKQKKKTQKEFVEEMSRVNPNIEVVGNYENSKTKILVKCKRCGKEWESAPDHLLEGKGHRGKCKTIDLAI